MELKANRLALKVALTYVIVAGCWFLFFDGIAQGLAGPSANQVGSSILKDFGFVILTGALLYQGLRCLRQQWEREMTLRKESGKSLPHTERALKTLSACNGVLVRATSESMLLSEICRVIVEAGGYRMAWVGFAADDEVKSVRIVAQAGLDEGYLGKSKISWSETSEHGRGPVGITIRTGQMTVCNDFQTDSRVAPWREEAFKRGYASNMVLPLGDAGKTIGVLAFYAAETGAFNAAEIELLTELGEDLAYGLQTLRTRLKHASAVEALRASESRLQFLLTATPAIIYSLRPNGDFATTFVSHNVREVLGYDAEAFNHDPLFWLAHVHPDDVPAAVADFEDLPAKGVIRREYRFRHRDGSYRWMHDEMRVVHDAQSQAQEFVGYWFDISERKQAEERMELQLSALTATANAIVITDREGKIEWANPAFTKLTGYNVVEVIGGNPRTLKSGEHPPEFYADLWATIRSGKVWHGELVNKRKNGQHYHEDMTITPVRSIQGQITHFVAIKQDVTERRQLEDQLRQSQKMDAIGQLAGGVAHDFNNILAALLVQVELINMVEDLPEEVRDGLNQIHTGVNHAASLTRQLLLFSRRQVMQPRPLDLNEVVTNLVKMLQRVIGENVRLQLNLHSSPLITHADAGMIEQVLMNLAINARDAMPEGGRLSIDTVDHIVAESLGDSNPDAAPGRYVCLRVSDTGHGIPPEVLPRIFEPFFTTKEAGKGTGLGLATVFGIVKQHHGWIKVDNQPGRGVAFQIYFPASTVTPLQAPATEAKPKPRGGTETILLVEDDPAVRRSLRTILEKHGYRVVECVNGIEALDLWLVYQRKVALVLTDLTMPGDLSGQELARHLRAAQPDLKVIFMSGYSAEVAGREFQLHHGENFIQKPFTIDHLLETIRRSLEH